MRLTDSNISWKKGMGSETADLTKDELYIPSVISKAIKNNQIRVKTFKTLDKWYGITYRNDLEEIKEAIGGYINYGLYEGT